MNPSPSRRNTPAEQQAYDRVCERLSGFDETLHFETVDGLLCALAAAPRVPPADEWLPALLGDTFDRVFADPPDRGQALGALQARLAVLCSQLDPEALFDDPDGQRLDPLMAEWTDEDRARLVAEGTPAERAAEMQTGAEWAAAFLRGIDALPALWALPGGDEAESARADFDRARAQLVALAFAPGSDALRAHAAAWWNGREPTRDELLTEAAIAVQDLRMLWIDYAPRPPTRRVTAAPGRNDPCPCGSGRKYKKCCGAAAAA